MASEQFLVNPPKHAPQKVAKSRATIKHKRASISMLGKEGSLHRPRVYTMGGHWQTSSAAKVAKPGLRINPFKRNPMGEELMFIGANPFREVKKVKHSKKAHSKSPFTFHSLGAPKAHKKSHRGKYRHNPMGVDASSVKPLLGALAGGLATALVPGLVGNFISGANAGIMGYITKAVILVGGTFGANKIAGKEAAVGFAGGSLVTTAVQAVNEYMPNLVSGSVAAAPSYPARMIAPVAVAPVETAVAGFERLNGFERLDGTKELYSNPLG